MSNLVVSDRAQLTSLDFYYLAVSSNIFLYGYLFVLMVGFFGNICQIITFSRKTMRRVSTGVLFLALSVSDTLYLLLCFYVLIIYGFQQTDRSNQFISCRIRHFTSYFATNFSAWLLTLISCDRWIRTQFPLRAQQLCTTRHALFAILFAIVIDILLHCQLFTPLYGPITTGFTLTCGPNPYYSSYTYFFNEYWPIITLLTVNLLPASAMILFLIGIIINVQTRRNRVLPFQNSQVSSHEKRRARFLHRQMFILMLSTLSLFLITTLPVALFRFTISTLGVQQPFSLSLLLSAIFGMITASNYALNFYLHCLTSKLYRKEFRKSIPCSISIRFKGSRNTFGEGSASGIHGYLYRTKQGTITQLIGKQSNTRGIEKQDDTSC